MLAIKTDNRKQNLLFLDGIFGDKEIGGYRTEKENSVLAVMRRITSLYKNNKEEKSVEISSLSRLVRTKGLEPPRRQTLDPKSSAATNYATCAFVLQK